MKPVSVLLAFAIALSSCQSARVTNGGRWLYSIDVEGQPLVKIDLIKLPNNPLIGTLSLRHALIYNGDQYLSRFYIPLLDSSLVKTENGVFRWKDLEGNTRLLRIRNPDSNFQWRIVSDNSNGYIVISSENGAFFHYKGCLLDSYWDGKNLYKFEITVSESGKIEEFTYLDQAILNVQYNSDNEIENIKSKNANLAFWYNDNHQLVEISDAPRSRALIVIDYDSCLVSKICTPQHTYAYKWGLVKHSPYAYFSFPLFPVVVHDSQFTYKASATSARVSFGVVDGDGHSFRGWSYDMERKISSWN